MARYCLTCKRWITYSTNRKDSETLRQHISQGHEIDWTRDDPNEE